MDYNKVVSSLELLDVIKHSSLNAEQLFQILDLKEEVKTLVTKFYEMSKSVCEESGLILNDNNTYTIPNGDLEIINKLSEIEKLEISFKCETNFLDKQTFKNAIPDSITLSQISVLKELLCVKN